MKNTNINMSPLLFKIMSSIMASLLAVVGVVLYVMFMFILENKESIASNASSSRENRAQWEKMKNNSVMVGRNRGAIERFKGYQEGHDKGYAAGQKNIKDSLQIYKYLESEK